MVSFIFPFVGPLLKMELGLDYANALKDPNFFQCQLMISVYNSVTHHGP